MLTDADDNHSAAATDRAACTTSRPTAVATPMATERRCGTSTRSPVIVMSDEFSGQSGVSEAGRVRQAAEGDPSSCMPLLVVPGTTPRSSTSSQSCLSVPGIADINGYITSFDLVV